mmetsp:Transcript_5339/g.10416  ORF Transcript_5339/g.10416 Transcript_5339/m.10416 type:complete len:536 (+) Transcript_5339:30-1637(+)
MAKVAPINGPDAPSPDEENLLSIATVDAGGNQMEKNSAEAAGQATKSSQGGASRRASVPAGTGLVRTLTARTAAWDVGKGYDDWLPPPESFKMWRCAVTAAEHGAQQFVIMCGMVAPSLLVVWCVSFLVEAATESWQLQHLQVQDSNPIIAGIIGEPFHALSPELLYGTFVVLGFFCPVFCCQTKLFGHLYLLYGARVFHVLKISIPISTGILVCVTLSGPVVMHATGDRVPRIVWMSFIFVLLFGGYYLCGRKAGQILDQPTLKWRFARPGIFANIMLYVYAVFFPFAFFSTDLLAIKMGLAIVFHPLVEQVVSTLFAHSAAHLRENNPNTAFYQSFHFSSLFALYGNFLLVNFDQAWHSILAYSLLKTVKIVQKVMSKEVSYAFFRMGGLPHDTVKDFMGSLRFQRNRCDVINVGILVETGCIVTAAFITWAMRFNRASDATQDAGDLGSYTPIQEICVTLSIQLAVAFFCDWIADVCLVWRGTPWGPAWVTMDSRWILKCAWIFFASVVMFLFYFYPFLSSRMCTRFSCHMQ